MNNEMHGEARAIPSFCQGEGNREWPNGSLLQILGRDSGIASWNPTLAHITRDGWGTRLIVIKLYSSESIAHDLPSATLFSQHFNF